ncbi:MAG TPA: N-acetylglucosamine-6-phosphate deacetylase, partial [Chitinophagaceae bacterium]|nr:N-acetylglucosamine-6-phosphate deacetylase [Chitinophagaceae bacterium]
EEVQSLLTYGKGAIKMITLAPEVCDAAIINYIQSEGIIVSAGHSDAD